MHATSFLSFNKAAEPLIVQSKRSLSDYFPAGTQYFYGYPAGEDATFVNYVRPEVEELVAARAFSCAGPQVSIISFAATSGSRVSTELLNQLRIPHPSASHHIVLPANIDRTITGAARNTAIKEALKSRVTPGALVMAQPFVDDEELNSLYQIPPSLTAWLNDKQNLAEYLSPDIIPKRLAQYDNGQQFTDDVKNLPLPYVAKAALSSSGDGVCICLSADDSVTAIKTLGKLSMPIVVEQYVAAAKNYGVHFGIPYDSTKTIDILGVNEQLTTVQGEFLGGTISSTDIPPVLETSIRYLQQIVLPHIRQMGWYGVGCFDVLVDSADQPYFIDCNFRMTGMSAYHFLLGNNVLSAPLVTFSGSFDGGQAKFERAINSVGKQLQLISLSHDKGHWSFNAALMYPDTADSLVAELMRNGIKSDGLDQLAE